MKRIILCAFALTLTISSQVGCGDAGGQLGLDPNASTSCDFQISSFLNGPNANQATSQWNCRSNNQTAAFQAFTDGTGLGSSGSFTWSQTGCRSVTAHDSQGIDEYTNIQGTTSSGILTFDDTFEGNTVSVSCVIQTL